MLESEPPLVTMLALRRIFPSRVHQIGTGTGAQEPSAVAPWQTRDTTYHQSRSACRAVLVEIRINATAVGEDGESAP